MSLSLSESQAVNEMAKVLYNFLPGNPHPYADQSVSFKGIAYEMGLMDFWPRGSKTPAITTLLEKTLDIKRDLFCNLLLEIVRRGIKYTNNQITREEIEELNQLIEKVGFKIPELWDSDFMTSLPSEAKTPSEKTKKVNKEDLKRLEEELIRISEIKDQSRGFAFERYLNECSGCLILSLEALSGL